MSGRRSWMSRISLKESLALCAFTLFLTLVTIALLRTPREAGSVPQATGSEGLQAGSRNRESDAIGGPRAAEASPVACLRDLALPAELDVQLVGVYQASDQAGREAVAFAEPPLDGGRRGGVVEVRVGKTAKPLLLVLSAYEPVHWALQVQAGADLRGVIASGYHAPTVSGIGASGLLVQTSHDRPQPGCPYFLAYEGDHLASASRRVKDWTTHPIHRMQRRYAGSSFDVGAVVDAAPVVVAATSPRVVEASPVVVSVPPPKVIVLPSLPTPPPGEEGLTWLENQGKLRMATDADIAAWYAAAGRDRGEGGGRLGHHRPYVVLAELMLPDGLTGAHGQTFIIPRNVPFPRGPRGHNVFLRMHGGVCVQATNLSC